MVKAICPGSFDPPTCGHLDIIERAAEIFDHVVIGIAPTSATKQPLFSFEERRDMILEITAHRSNITVIAISGLLVEAAREHGCRVIVRGMRAVMDFEYEFQMGMMNKKLAPDLETMFLVTSAQFAFISSTLVKDVARNGGSLDGVVPPTVVRRLQALHPSHPRQR